MHSDQFLSHLKEFVSSFEMSIPLDKSCLSKKLLPKTLLVKNVQIETGIIDAIAYSYDPVSSSTKIIAVIGVQ